MITLGPGTQHPYQALDTNAALFTVYDAETHRIIAVDKTLTEACRIRDGLMTLGLPRVRPARPGDIEE